MTSIFNDYTCVATSARVISIKGVIDAASASEDDEEVEDDFDLFPEGP